MTRDPEFEAWIAEARRVTVEKAAALLRFQPTRATPRRKEMSGPCPRCAGVDRFSVHTARQLWHCRGCQSGGRDGLGLVMFGLGLDFLDACEAVAGPRPVPPAGETAADRSDREARMAARLAEIDRAREADAAAREDRENAYRRDERAKAFRFWGAGQPLSGAAADYLAARGLDWPARIGLRWHPAWTLYDGVDEDKRPIALHRGPALFAPIVEGEGDHRHFLGLHTTWFDAGRPGEKVTVEADGERVPAKKIRGAHRGGHIELVRPDGAPTRMVIGEGIETTLSVWTVLARARSPLLQGLGVRSSVSLGNLAGRALDRARHPTATTTDKAGRTRAVIVPGVVPDLADRAVVIPDSVTDLWLVGDGDSEAFFTRCALARAAARHARAGRTVRILMARPGADFNDMLRGRA